MYLEVMLDRHLAGQSDPGPGFGIIYQGALGRQDSPAAFVYHNPALTAGSTATAGGRNRNFLLGQCGQQFSAGLGGNFLCHH